MLSGSIATNSLKLKDILQEYFMQKAPVFLCNCAEDLPEECLIICLENCSPEAFGDLSGFTGLIAGTEWEKGIDLVFATDFSEPQWHWFCVSLQQFVEQKALLLKQTLLNQEMTHIGIALSAEKELPRLLTLILEEGRKLSNCEAASLYLVDRSEKSNPQLKFMLFQNEKLDVPFKEKRYPLSNTSMAGHVAITGKPLNIPDVYQIESSSPYVFDDGFDRAYHYKTREVLTIPMRNHQDDIIGILQFLNRKIPSQQGQPFDETTCQILQSMASQSAVAIDNSLLIENIRELFEGFVSAAVTAIEARDPVTSGHSFRVAHYTCALAEHLPKSRELINQSLTVEQMRELRYAALLHDFGKVGVREHILQKAKKLSPLELELIRWRIKWYREKLRADLYQGIHKRFFMENNRTRDLSLLIEEQIAVSEQKIDQLGVYLEVIEQANEPSVLPQEQFSKLEELRKLTSESSSYDVRLLTENEFLSLSVSKGSLTDSERLEIESHVSHTFEFLKRIPWTNDLKDIPFIASAHHEKMDGSGYPFGLTDKDLPVQTRIMTIADIYDALTASDRPYKSALSSDKALSILQMEADTGKLDPHLVGLFVEAKIFLISS